MAHIRKAKIVGIMLFVVAAIVPVIVRLAAIPVAPELLFLVRDDMHGDIFSYYKGWVLMTCAGVILVHLIAESLIKDTGIYTGGLKQKAKSLFSDPVIVMVAVYLLFVFISNILSPYTHTAMWGTHDRREGLFVQLAYMAVFLATLFYVKDKVEWEFRTKLLLTGLLVSSLIMGMIGFSQFINRDFFATSIGQWLITPRHLDFVELAVGFDIAYGTNFNPNTFGLVTAMLFPLLLGAALAFPGRVWRGLFLFASLLMIIGVVGSRSVGGFIGAATAVAAIAITLAIRWLVSREKSVFSARGVAILLIGLVVIAGTGFALRQPLYDNLSFTMGRISAIFEPPEVHLPEFTFQENRLTMTDRGVTYHITFPATGVPEVTTADGTPIEHSAERDDEADLIRYTYEVPGFGTVAVQRNEAVYLYRGILMTVEDGLLHMLMFNGDMINPNEPIPSWGFEGWETWGSNRGFIFARTIPLLPQFWLVGNGSDTFGLAFPNHDLISKARYFGSPYIVVDKAHNLYLQTAVTTGWISAFALIGLFGYFMLTSFWSLIKDSQEGVSVFWLRLGILASVSAFAISSLSTDSTVSSTPIFLIILGIGYALNKLSPKRGQGD